MQGSLASFPAREIVPSSNYPTAQMEDCSNLLCYPDALKNNKKQHTSSHVHFIIENTKCMKCLY